MSVLGSLSNKQKHGCSRLLNILKGVLDLHPYAGLGRSRLCLRFLHGSGILDRYPRKARAFPALPPFTLWLGCSRPYPCTRARVFPALPQSFNQRKDQRRFRSRASPHATVQTRGPIHASRTARRRPSAN